MSRLIHLDTDIGGDPDDLSALVMLLGWPGVELTGVTTVCDDGGQRAGFVRYILDLAGRANVPVAAGAAGSLAGYPSVPGIGDPARYWPEPIAPLPAAPGAALDLLAESITAGATIVAIGPFTNLAMLETVRPGLLATVPVVVMGGFVAAPGAGLPPWDASMDWNVQSDRDAARIVFATADPIVVPLDVTLQTALRRAQLPALRDSGPLGRLLATQASLAAEAEHMHDLARRYPALPDDLLNFQHDPLACAVAAGWDGAVLEDQRLSPVIDGGQLVLAADAGGAWLPVVRQVDRERFDADWLAAVRRADLQSRE